MNTLSVKYMTDKELKTVILIPFNYPLNFILAVLTEYRKRNKEKEKYKL